MRPWVTVSSQMPFADEVNQLAAEADRIPAYSQGAEKLRTEASKFADLMGGSNRPTTFAHAENIKRGYDKSINWDKDQAVPQEMVKKLRGRLNKNIEGEMERAAGPDLLAEFRREKRLYGNLANVVGTSEDAALRSQANRYISPSDYGAGGASALMASGKGESTAASSATGAIMSLAHRLLRERGSSTMATGSRATAEMMGDLLPMLASRGAFGKYGAIINRELAEHGAYSAMGLIDALDREGKLDEGAK